MERTTERQRELIEESIKFLLECEDFEDFTFNEKDETQDIIELTKKEYELQKWLSRIGSLWMLAFLEKQEKNC